MNGSAVRLPFLLFRFRNPRHRSTPSLHTPQIARLHMHGRVAKPYAVDLRLPSMLSSRTRAGFDTRDLSVSLISLNLAFNDNGSRAV